MKDRTADNFKVVETFDDGETGRLWNNRDKLGGTKSMEDSNRKKALVAALSQIEKQFGKGSVMRLGEHPANNDIEVVSTGSLGLDVALGVGGVPRGRVVEVYGPEASGKTTLALSIISQVQKLGGVAAFVDAEHALDPSMPKNSASTSRNC